jgi:acyl-CoA thioester hydrolase
MRTPVNRPPRGDFDGDAHVFPLRVYYEDTDAAGIVYYANYLRFAERARTEMMRALGVEHLELMAADGIAFAVRRCSADYLAPARLDDRLEVVTRITDLRGASLGLEQTVRRDAADLVRMHLKIACMTVAGRPARFPGTLRAELEDLRNRKNG